MVGYKTSPVNEGSNLRKLRKPLVEKKRRERMNTSIERLRKMLTQSRPEIDSDTKLDKAEILEMTVNHLTTKQSTPTDNNSYSKGFSDCSRETIRYLATSGILDPASLSRLSTHLLYASGTKSTTQSTIPVPMEIVRPTPQRFCSTPLSQGVPAYPGNISIATTPVMPQSYTSHSFTSFSSSDDSSSGSDVSLLSNTFPDEKPWRPW